MLLLLKKLFFGPQAQEMNEQSARLQRMRKVDVINCAPVTETKSLSDRIQPVPVPNAQVWRQETVTEHEREREIARQTGLEGTQSYFPGGSRQGLDSARNFSFWLRALEA